MALRFMYITNNVEIAHIAEQAGTDRIWIDLERRGKEERQRNMNTQKSMHVPEDISRLKNVLTKSEILVRINPLYSESKKEIDDVIRRGADIIMLPMFTNEYEVEKFVDIVNGRRKVMLLLETREAVNRLDAILAVSGIDEIHIGLNDLHLSYGMKFMFEPLANEWVDSICTLIERRNIPYGFGGIATLDGGLLPAKIILGEHYRLKSRMVILSRSFCDSTKVNDMDTLANTFVTEVKRLREYEVWLSKQTLDFYDKNHKQLQEKVKTILMTLK